MSKHDDSHPLDALRDQYGMPPRRSIERCVENSRNIAYAKLRMRTFFVAALVTAAELAVLAEVIYGTWFLAWMPCALRGPWFDLIDVPSFWSKPLSVHGNIFFAAFVAIKLFREYGRSWENALVRMRLPPAAAFA